MRRLLWRLFPTYLIFIVICTGATGLYAWRASRDFFIAQTTQHLKVQAQVIRDRMNRPLDADSQPDLEAQARRLAALCECRITIIQPDGGVIAESNRDPESLLNHANRPEIREAMAGRVGSSLRYSGTLGQEMLYVALPLEQSGQVAGVLRVSRPLTAINRELGGVYFGIGIAAVLVALLAAALALGVSRMLSRPLEEIRAGAERFARGDLGHRLYVPRTEEIGAVAASLNQMAGQLDEKIRTVIGQKTQQEAILASMAEGVVAVDTEGRVLSLNQAAVRLFTAEDQAAAPGGQPPSPAEFVGRPLNEVIRHAQLERMVKRVLSDGKSAEAEVTMRLDREDHSVQVHATSLRENEHGMGALLVLNDVTRMRRLERVRQDFVANVSHELKTPITSIKGFVETLRDGSVEPERASRFLEIVATQADRLHAIIEDLLTLSRLEQEADKAEIRMEVAPVRRVLQQAVDVCQLVAEARRVKLCIACDDELKARMNGPLLEQAVSNLLDNAIKYSEADGAIELSAEAVAGNGVVVRVRDHGCGIPSEHLPRLFERFYRVDRARSRSLGGTGLGLAIVKHIVNAHGGTVAVTSTPGQGSTFTLHLPGRPS